MARPTFLRYMGGITRDAGDYFAGVPPRDLTEADIALLDDATLTNIMATPAFAEGSPYSGPLYTAEKAAKVKPVADSPTEPPAP